MLRNINKFKSSRRFDWAPHHNAAVDRPTGNELAILSLFDGFLTFLANFDTGMKIAEDHYLSILAESTAEACLRVLDFDLGRLDGATLDGAIRGAMREAGFDGGEWAE